MNKSGKWVRLMGLVGCTMWMASCQETPGQQDQNRLPRPQCVQGKHGHNIGQTQLDTGHGNSQR